MPLWLIPVMYTVASVLGGLIEDLLRRLGSRQLDAGYARHPTGAIRLTFPVPTWQDSLALSFDEILQFGASSIQVTDDQDQVEALQEDRQGLGLSRKRVTPGP